MTFDPKKLDKLKSAQAKWEKNTLKPTIERRPERKKTFVTQSSVPTKRLYTPLDIPDLDYES